MNKQDNEWWKGSKPLNVELDLVRGSDVQPKPVSWLWRYWLQRSAFNLIAGRIGSGKSTIALAFCATVTRGGSWPDAPQNVLQWPHGRGKEEAVYWSGEDSIDETLVPRFMAMGGDLDHMHFIRGVTENGKKRPFDPSTDMSELTCKVEKLSNVGLIVLDPIAMVIKGDSHKNVETRIGLQPFNDLCMSTGAGGLGVHHLTKFTAGQDPLDRVSGSLAFGALPRAVLLAAQDLNAGEGARRALMRGKVSNGPSWGGLDYQLRVGLLDGFPHIETQSVWWGDKIEGTAREILDTFEGKARPKRSAEAFLVEMLKQGPRLATELYAEAEELGIKPRTLREAYNRLGGVAEQKGFQGQRTWKL
jgi:putative DNA primase/helicase